MSIGEDLAEARRRAGLTVTQVSQQTCIRGTIILAIERDDYRACGGDFYARGHIRAIARAIGADPGPLLAGYEAAHPLPPPAPVAELFGSARPVKIGRRHRLNWTAVLAVALVTAVSLVAYHLLAASHHGPDVHAAARARLQHAAHTHHAAPPPIPAATTPAPAPYAHKIVIRLTAIQDCWVGFTTPAGGYLSQSYVVAGQSKRWTFWHPVHMRLGSPGGIALTVDGKHPLLHGIAHPVTLRLGLGGKASR